MVTLFQPSASALCGFTATLAILETCALFVELADGHNDLLPTSRKEPPLPPVEGYITHPLKFLEIEERLMPMFLHGTPKGSQMPYH